jgi:hypothetical protein
MTAEESDWYSNFQIQIEFKKELHILFEKLFVRSFKCNAKYIKINVLAKFGTFFPLLGKQV